MLYLGTLHLHALVWWIILFTGVWAVFRVWQGLLAGSPWTRHERTAGLVFSTALATQLLIGLALYFQSPLKDPLFAGGAAGAERVLSIFFGLVHPLAMFTAVVCGQIGYSLSKRLADPRGKYRAAAACYTAALVIVLLSVPWHWSWLPYGQSLMP